MLHALYVTSVEWKVWDNNTQSILDVLHSVVVQIADTAQQNEFPICNCPVVRHCKQNRRLPATHFPPYNGSKHYYCFFHCCTVHLITVKSFIYQRTHYNLLQKDTKIYVKITLKLPLHVSVFQPSSGSLLLWLAKVIILK